MGYRIDETGSASLSVNMPRILDVLDVELWNHILENLQMPSMWKWVL
jgi:hypothetical protein